MILSGKEARDKLMEGVNLVADTVMGTLGPKAKTVVIKQNNKPVVINDGVTIAKAVFSDWFKRLPRRLKMILVMEPQLLLFSLESFVRLV